MKSLRLTRSAAVLWTLLIAALWNPNQAFAHCDGMDGPVVTAAREALKTRNVKAVLIWVSEENEEEIKTAFQKTLAVRELNPEACELADRYFFETVVHIHRAGEDAPYTGLKPAGQDLGQAIPAADKAIATGSVDDLLDVLTDSMQAGVRERFDQVVAEKKFTKDDVSAGREYVKAYVEFIHYVEAIHQAIDSSSDAHTHRSQHTVDHPSEH